MTQRRLGELLLGNVTLLFFIVVFLWFGVQAPRFFSIDSIANIVKQASFIGVIAVGMTFVLLTAGIDLSVGSNMYLSAMAAGYLLQSPAFHGSAGTVAAIFAGLLVGTIFGALNGFCIVVLRISPFLTTLATLVAGRGLGTAITESFGIEYPASFLAFGASDLFGIPIQVVVFGVLVLAAHVLLTHSQFGVQVRATGNDPDAARKAGINVDRVTFSVYVICGFCAAVGGITLIALIGRLNQTFGVGKEFDVITAAVLGGTSLFGGFGTAWGAVVGSTLVQMVQSGMIFTGVNLYLQPMVLALVIFFAVLIDALKSSRLKKLQRRLLRHD